MGEYIKVGGFCYVGVVLIFIVLASFHVINEEMVRFITPVLIIFALGIIGFLITLHRKGII